MVTHHLKGACDKYACPHTHQYQIYAVGIFLLCILGISCSVSKLGPDKIRLVVRELNSGLPVDTAKVAIFLRGLKIDSALTDELGYAEFNCEKNLRKGIGDFKLSWSRTFNDGGRYLTASDTIKLNRYIPFYDVYLDKKDAASFPLDTNNLIADMHYHVSMRIHNLFGVSLYEKDSHPIPDNLNWYKDFNKLRVLYKGKWKKPYLGLIESPYTSARIEQRKKDLMTTLLDQHWVRSKGGSNKLTQYTQATFPHVKEGKVYLAFNAMSAFEHNVSNTPTRRFVNNFMVTGAPLKWLKRLGKNDHITHWQNFNLEYNMIKNQRRNVNNYELQFYDTNTNLYHTRPTVVSAIEGSHSLQDTFFPHAINYNIGQRTPRQTEALFSDIITIKAISGLNREGLTRDIIRKLRADYISTHFSVDTTKKIDTINGVPRLRPLIAHTEGKDSIVDAILINELIDNIDSLKKLDPPICMMTIAHLTYNGMMGHAPALDQGKFPNSLVASKNYSIRVSDEKAYKQQWEKTFFSIPGVNKFGKVVIDSLLSSTNGHRILIDLKHSDLFTREYFYDSIMIKKTGYVSDTIPPICSHCGVTGLATPYYSPFVDEYSLTQAPSTKTFYPFGINIFNGEITIICTSNGIIGVPLEQRILGGYINKRVLRKTYITNEGVVVEKSDLRQYRGHLIRRWGYMKRWLTHYLIEKDSIIESALIYIRDTMHVGEIEPGKYQRKIWNCSLPTPISSRDDWGDMETQCYRLRMRDILQVLWKDYISAEPFLQNVFHIIDHSGLTPAKAWKHVCIGSDLDGLIDPIDICSTAGQYPIFKKRLKQFIPVFLQMRRDMDPMANHHPYNYYFDNEKALDNALDQLFYKSLRDFTDRYFLAP